MDNSFSDLIPQETNTGNSFSDLIPKKSGNQEGNSFADLIPQSEISNNSFSDLIPKSEQTQVQTSVSAFNESVKKYNEAKQKHEVAVTSMEEFKANPPTGLSALGLGDVENKINYWTSPVPDKEIQEEWKNQPIKADDSTLAAAGKGVSTYFKAGVPLHSVLGLARGAVEFPVEVLKAQAAMYGGDLKPQAEIVKGLFDFIGRPTGVKDLVRGWVEEGKLTPEKFSEFEDAWTKDPFGSVMAVIPFVKGGLKTVADTAKGVKKGYVGGTPPPPGGTPTHALAEAKPIETQLKEPSPEHVAGRVPIEDLPEGLKTKDLLTEGFPEGFSAKKVETGLIGEPFKSFDYEITMPDGTTFNTSSLDGAKKFANKLKDIVDPVQKEKPATVEIPSEQLKNRLSKPAFELYQKNIADVGKDMFGDVSKGGRAFIEGAEKTHDQIGVLAHASTDIRVRRDAIKIIKILSDRVDENTINIRLQKLLSGLETPKNYTEYSIFSDFIKNSTQKEITPQEISQKLGKPNQIEVLDSMGIKDPIQQKKAIVQDVMRNPQNKEQNLKVLQSIKDDVIKSEIDKFTKEPTPPSEQGLGESGSVNLAPVAPIAEGLKETSQGLKSLLLPSSKSPQHLRAAEVIGSKFGSMNRRAESTLKQTGYAKTYFDKQGVTNENIPLAENMGVKFMSDMSQGRPQSTPQLQKIASHIKTLFEDRVKKIQTLGTGALETVKENYFPGMWKRGSQNAALSYLSKTPLEGSKSFLKPKVYDDIMDGIKEGLEPISTNPLDLVNLKLAEMDRYIMAHEAINEFKQSGDIKFIKVLEKIPVGFEPIPKYGDVFYRTEKGELAKAGQYVGSKPVVDIFNNYLSQSLYNNPYFSKPFKVYMGVSNLLNQSQLGVGSAFHAGFTSSEVTISSVAEVIKDTYGVLRGNRSIGDLTKTVSKVPASFTTMPYKGSQVIKEWNNPGIMNPKIQQIAKAAELAGARFTLESGLRTKQTSKLVSDWYGGKKLKAALRSPVAFIELTAKPIMDFLVPKQKAGLFGELAGRIIEMNPDIPLEKLRPQFRQAWNRVNSRLGQVSYDTYFINNAAKNVIQGLVRAPGWSGGTIAEIGGSLKDTVSFFKEWKDTGKLPQNIPDRVAYTAALLTTVSVMNGILTYVFTGEKPQGMDYLAFRTGGEDEEGRPERFVLPTYMKDVFAYYGNPVHTLIAKSHPMLSMVGDIARNKDYYNTMIRNPDDTLGQQAVDLGGYVVKQFIPFWIRGILKEKERSNNPLKLAAPYIGVMPATTAYTLSNAEKKAREYMIANMPVGTKTHEKAQASSLKKKLYSSLRKDPQEGLANLGDAISEGKITPEEAFEIYKGKDQPYLSRIFTNLDIDQAVDVYKVADDKEKELLKPLLIKKAINKIKSDITSEKRKKIMDKVISLLQEEK